MITPKALKKFSLTALLVFVVVFFMSWYELTRRAREQMDMGREYLAQAKSLLKANKKNEAYSALKEAGWAFETVEQLLTSGTRRTILVSELTTGMLLADPVYPDGLREADYDRQLPAEVVVDSYTPLAEEDITKIRALTVEKVRINADYSVTQSSSLLAEAKVLLAECYQLRPLCQPRKTSTEN